MPTMQHIQLMAKRALLPLFLVIIFVTAATGARAASADLEFRQGLSAFNAGKFDEALRVWGKLAESGDPRSEAGLGFLYHHGMGTKVDERKAVLWLTKAAEHGQAEGQLLLGSLYFYGQGVAQSYIYAFAWCDIAQESGQSDAFLCREAASQGLKSAEEQSEAQRLGIELRDRILRSR